MSNSLLKEDYLIRIRAKLRNDGIKLWQPPYFQGTKISDDDIKNLSNDIGQNLNIPVDICQDILKTLQAKALENLKQKNLYQESGLATIKIKILQQSSPKRVIQKELLLSMTTIELKEIIKNDADISLEGLKLINSGRILKDPDSLGSQGVKNGSQILAIILTETSSHFLQTENQIKELESIKTDSKLLALDNEYMQVEDQFGNSLKIPPEERKALVVAMALHEKGKYALKRDDYSRALVFFLEADQEFSQCNSQLLKTVDNYALLDLDIAWCYLCLESFVQLPEAEERLKRCEQKFHSTYGPNLERLVAVKGTPGNEEALFMRLHLLQAIVFYHQNKRLEALNLLRKAEQELESLKVDEQSLVTLVELGYTTTEATLGLRATRGDVNRAANYINENREKREEARKKAKAEAILEKERKKLGFCVDGKQYVDPKFVKILVNMGYSMEASRIALKNCNNIITDSVQYIQENPLPGPSGSKSTQLLSFLDELTQELESAGFDPRMARLALSKHSGDIMKAAEELIENDGIVLGDLSDIVGVESLENIKKRMNENKEKNKALQRLKEDMETVDDDHLDINLVKEEMFLRQYLSLLNQ
ncbi:NEDD8 ultimate buster 1-like isoform X1 [Diorhabda sublineata]|uniref:NEDD8 ultimate buster 1-like isoform X1 n=1 Tax=Diorhabda sublineata TaxID=1163346 RepID=UPI0024E06DEB|nr:NEDD8 ultimate buster 1-like isoform X1 [Diorhabda sublineata]XP_056638845.1 NEDD8 ultimate buster 1-like isoform X1 [Diorhabda sublineata]XP_056638846.1 NEDD8 ultimate buster 1-like isoform X1 [Diorhabda sublineata]XP_056638847.1 NEDD8 ultimate buster 1-like isoform X1 [Diorhabda sublineata]XP_056638849.1 NEDD8 ultimate buster 1-like isoform X1 [Diorhabda sublineata]